MPSWSEKEDQFVRDNYDKMSATQVAIGLQREFGIPRSRNAVIGRADRIGAKSRPKNSGVVTATQRKARAARAKLRGREHPAALTEKVNKARAEALQEAPDLPPAHNRRWVDDKPDGGGITLAELTPKTCCWPVGGTGVNMRFCGAPIAGTSERGYCEAHQLRAYRD